MIEKQKRNMAQDIQIAELREWKKAFEKRFDDFIKNDFTSLKGEMKDVGDEVKEVKNWLFFGFVAFIGLSVLAQVVLSFFK